MASTRPRRTCRVDGSGFYHDISATYQKCLENVDTEQLAVDEEELPNGVYSVERVVSSRQRGAKVEYLVLWSGYSREDATWVARKDLTECALRSFETPSPDHRAIADSVSNLVTAVQNSLRHGCVRNCMFVVPFRCDVFNFLFSGKGSSIHGKKGRFYSEADFDPTYFSVNWFVSYSKLGDGCIVEFPIVLRSHVKFSPCTYTKNNDNVVVARPRDFTELLSVSVVKNRC